MSSAQQQKQFPPLVSRKDISLMLGGRVSVKQIRDHEREWGLLAARADLGTRTVLFRYHEVIIILRARGALP